MSFPNIKKYFKDENLIKQNIYKSKTKYNAIYINSNLYQEIFNEDFNWDKSSKVIEDLFSITLNKSNSNNEKIGDAYVDKQSDPFGISLSGNLGSGRAYFFDNYFNIKGDKTLLATSKQDAYSNGKFSLPAAIRSAIYSNILFNDLIIPTYQTLAVIVTDELFEFEDDVLDDNNNIITNKFLLPCALEIRINKDQELYRISNFIIDEKTLSEKDLLKLIKNITKLEANKYIHRLLHGSWSVGNISTKGNLIDFDTCNFVKCRHPQYSNTNKYKSTYFGYELEGWTNIIKYFNKDFNLDIEKHINQNYEKYLKENFIDLIGLDKFKNKINNKKLDVVYKYFYTMSKLYINNYNGFNVNNEISENTAIFDFSNFFQKYLLLNQTNLNLITGNILLFNKIYNDKDKYPQLTKQKVDEYFNDSSIDNEYSLLRYSNEFIKLYIDLFKDFNDDELKDIIYKQYIINENRYFLYGYNNLFYDLSVLYANKKIPKKTLNTIINYLIISNYRTNNETFLLKLKINKNGLSFITLTKKYYYVTLIPFININFAKFIINNNEFFMYHTNDILKTKNIYFDNLIEIDNVYNILINGNLTL